jgi:hypothetical protein
MRLATYAHQVDLANLTRNVLCLCQQEAAPPPRRERGCLRRGER